MESRGRQLLVNIDTLIKILVVFAIAIIAMDVLKILSIVYINRSIMNTFTTIFLSIILEGIPFIMIGAFISSLIQVFVSERTISRLIPKNRFIGIIISAVIGLIFPVCECAIIPITKRLIKKGVPTSMAITFMLSVPIVNPIVLMSTYYAFLGKPYMVIIRAGFGIVSAITIGCLISRLHKGNPLKIDQIWAPGKHEHHHEHHEENCCHHSSEHSHEHKQNGGVSKLFEVIEHTSLDVYDVGKYFIMGAFLAAFLQTFVPKNYLISIGSGNLSSILVMMSLAFILSICSETDAFIARTFLSQFTLGSIIGFLILGPMLDIKNTIMLCGNFKFTFAVKLIFLIVTICFVAAVTAGFIPLAWLGI